MARRAFQSIEAAAVAAEQAMANGRVKDAERAYRELLGQTHVVDYEYDDWLRALAELYRQLGRGRDAGQIYLYLHYFDLARACSYGRSRRPGWPTSAAQASRAFSGRLAFSQATAAWTGSRACS